jgi:hypothetical protein
VKFAVELLGQCGWLFAIAIAVAFSDSKLTLWAKVQAVAMVTGAVALIGFLAVLRGLVP